MIKTKFIQMCVHLIRVQLKYQTFLKSSQNLAKFTLIIQLIFTFYDEVYIAQETSAF